MGEWFVFDKCFTDEQNKPAVIIESLIQRMSKIARVSPGKTSEEQIIAANVTYAFIVTSANSDKNIKRLHRYLLLAKEGGVTPIILLSKVDLVEAYASLVKELRHTLKDTEVIALNVNGGIGVEKIKEKEKVCRQGVTTVFIGSSGVGKSTLVNALLGEAHQEINTIRQGDEKGKHTTTSRELFFLPCGSMIIDTPGIREIQVFGKEESLGSTFVDIDSLSKTCRFSDCTHTSEPGCAVLDAAKNGQLDEETLQSYHKLLKEMHYSNQQMNKRFSSNKKHKWKKVSKSIRNMKDKYE